MAEDGVDITPLDPEEDLLSIQVISAEIDYKVFDITSYIHDIVLRSPAVLPHQTLPATQKLFFHSRWPLASHVALSNSTYQVTYIKRIKRGSGDLAEVFLFSLRRCTLHAPPLI